MSDSAARSCFGARFQNSNDLRRKTRASAYPASLSRLNRSAIILEGTVTFQAGGQTIHAKPGDFIHIPRGTVHSLKNEGKVPARALIITSPAGPTGMQQFVEESFVPTTDHSATPLPMTEELVKRMMAAAARNGMELVKPA